MRRWVRTAGSVLAIGAAACGAQDRAQTMQSEAGAGPTIDQKLAQYTPVRLTADLSALSDRERRMIPLLIQAAQEMDTIFWQQVYPARDSLLRAIPDSATRRYVQLNYGPWDRLDGNAPFVPGVGPRPDGAAFYPSDMSKEEFDSAAKASAAAGAALRGLYTVVRRDSVGPARHRAVPRGLRRAEPAGGRQAARGGRAGGRQGSQAIPRASRDRPRDRRLSAERSGVDGHEVQRHRCRDRADRDLR